MKQYDYLIIGNGIAGVTAAETIRERDKKATMAIVSEEPYPLYSRILLSSFLKKKISRVQLFLRKTDDFAQKNIDLYLHEAASFLNNKRREIGLKNSGESLGYKKLLLATGGKTKPLASEDEENRIFRLQNLEDADRLAESINSIKNPLVIGGSFICLDFLDIFVANGLVPRLLVRGDYFLQRILDSQGGELLEINFQNYGIHGLYQDSIQTIQKCPQGIEVTTQKSQKILCDAIAAGVGLERNIDFLKNSGLETGKAGGIKTNEFLETAIKNIWAAGDVAEYYDVIFQEHRLVGNWTSAFLQGQKAGLNMTGQKVAFKNVSSYSLTGLNFQITALGKCESGLENIVRCDRYRHLYENFFLQNGVLVGTSLINCFGDKPHLAKLIETKSPLESYKNNMQNFDFDIKNIPVIE